jgi:2-aminoadipate transaminase
VNFEHLLAERTAGMGASAIREILKVVAHPGMVSLAGGIPAPESFPLDIMQELTQRVIDRYGPAAFQYDRTEGFIPLCEALVGHLAAKSVQATAEEIIVASGSQGVLDAIGKLLISKGDPVAVAAPTYLGAIQAFNPYEPTYVCMETDEQGLIPASLEQVLRTTPVKLIYLVPTFQNPTGRTIPLERRIDIARLIQKYNALLVEDDPYSDLRYRGDPVPPIKSLAPDHVVYAGTLSKTFAPGLRIGFCVAPPLIRRWLVLIKQGVDLHTSTFNQALAAEYISGGYLARHLPTILRLYRPRQNAMLAAMDRYLPAGFNWSQPEGGMFLWAEGPEGLDAEELCERCIDCNVAFVPGKYFYTEPGAGLATMRFNYTMIDETAIAAAVRTVAEVFAEHMSPA